MKHPVKTLAALAILGAVAPSTYAVSIKDDVVSLTPGVRLQTRAQMNDATSTTGGDYRIQSGTPGATDDAVDFMIRRARVYMNFKYGTNWKGQLAINADNVDNVSSNGTRPINLRYAWLERGFDMGDGMSHGITFGLNKPYQNPSDAAMSSSREFLPNNNAAGTYLAPRGVGAGYRFYHPVFLIAADLQNNTNTAQKDTSTTNATEEEGFYYGIRAEFSFSPDWFIKKRAESFVGKEGQGLNIGVSYGTNQDMRMADADPITAGAQQGAQNLTAYGVDVMFWLNGLSAYAEYRTGTTEFEANAGATAADVDSEFIVLQAGYAFPVGDEVLEPVLRYQIIDENTDADETVNYNDNNVALGANAAYGSTGNDSGGSGTQIDIGVNYYLNGHDNKLQLAVSLWESEEGSGDATIIRLQHHINF